jgi:hypothetical protein
VLSVLGSKLANSFVCVPFLFSNLEFVFLSAGGGGALVVGALRLL